MQYCKTTGLMILRLVLGGLFIYHGVTKFNASPEMIGFIGGAFHDLNLTFLSQATWTTILAVVEVVAGGLIVLGLLTRTAAIAIAIVMLGAMNVKGWSWPSIELDLVYLGTALAFIFAGPGKCSCDAKCCKSGSCCGQSCDTKTKNKHKGKEVIEA